jgi:hypothetical protein
LHPPCPKAKAHSAATQQGKDILRLRDRDTRLPKGKDILRLRDKDTQQGKDIRKDPPQPVPSSKARPIPPRGQLLILPLRDRDTQPLKGKDILQDRDTQLLKDKDIIKPTAPRGGTQLLKGKDIIKPTAPQGTQLHRASTSTSTSTRSLSITRRRSPRTSIQCVPRHAMLFPSTSKNTVATA